MSNQELVFESAGGKLSGTLMLPERCDRCPCVLMMSGSGRVDRDENHRRLPINVMGELAGHLAGREIASFRYDKRGVGRSEGDFWSTGLYDNVSDAYAALLFLKEHPQVMSDRIFVLGHSEGAYLAMRLAAQSPDLAGVVLLAGGARPGEEELLWQAAQVAKTLKGPNAWIIKLFHIDILKAQRKALDKIKRSRRDWYRAQLVAKVNAKWMREFLAYDPADDLRALRVPVLAITGSKDIQVDPANLERMAQLVTAPFESHVLPDVTHLLRSVAGPGGLATYKQQVHQPIDSRVSTLIINWLERQLRH